MPRRNNFIAHIALAACWKANDPPLLASLLTRDERVNAFRNHTTKSQLVNTGALQKRFPPLALVLNPSYILSAVDRPMGVPLSATNEIA